MTKLKLSGEMITIDLAPTAEELVKILGEALTKAHEHLEYCGYGDSWERECAEGLDECLEKALTQYKEHIK